MARAGWVIVFLLWGAGTVPVPISDHLLPKKDKSTPVFDELWMLSWYCRHPDSIHSNLICKGSCVASRPGLAGLLSAANPSSSMWRQLLAWNRVSVRIWQIHIRFTKDWKENWSKEMIIVFDEDDDLATQGSLCVPDREHVLPDCVPMICLESYNYTKPVLTDVTRLCVSLCAWSHFALHQCACQN